MMVVLPSATGITRPDFRTLATLSLADDQVTSRVKSAGLLPGRSPLAISWDVDRCPLRAISPGTIARAVGFGAGLASGRVWSQPLWFWAVRLQPQWILTLWHIRPVQSVSSGCRVLVGDSWREPSTRKMGGSRRLVRFWKWIEWDGYHLKASSQGKMRPKAGTSSRRTSGRIKAKSFLVEWINQMTFILSYIMNPPEK